jgi:hypothetical protein
VAQVDTGSVDSFDAATTYTVTINGQTVSVLGDTDVATTAGNLLTALQGSTLAYFTAVTWANPSGGTITGTAAVAGFPFTATLTVAGGTGTVTDFSNTTANAGPLVWDDANNWVGGVLPGAADNVVIEDGSGDIWFGLDGIAAALGVVQVLKTYNGRIGLNRLAFATGIRAEDSSLPEYRTDYLEISADEIDLGQQTGPGSPAGSPRVKVSNTKAGASVMRAYGTAPSSSEPGLPAIRYKAANAGADVIVLSAAGGVGIGKDFEGETATVGAIDMRSLSASDRVFIGSGVTYSTFKQDGGQNIIDAAGTVSSVRVTGGSLELTGDYQVTTLQIDAGTVTDNHINSGGDSVVTANLDAGELALNISGDARTYTTLNQAVGTTLVRDPAVVTITNYNLPSTDIYTLALTGP